MSTDPFDMMSDIPDEFFQEMATVDGNQYPCAPVTGVALATQISEIGADPNTEAALLFDRDVLATPAKDSLMTFRGEELRVDTVNVDSANISYTVFLIAKYGVG